MKKLLLTILSLFVVSCASNGSTSNDKTTSKEAVIPSDSHTLVAYFSVTKHTKPLAEFAQEHLNCDIFEIVPKQEYTEADIDYGTDCRANKEQNDPKARPEIKYQIEDISKYDNIVLGYPIWWAEAPKIMYTFIESYDFSNKTILPFCTSGSSPIGSSAINLAECAPNANWLEGKRFAIGTDKETFNNWLDSYFKKDNDMKLEIDNRNIDVTWLDNDSIKALKKLLPLTINMHEYGGFEQTGSIGQSIVSNDEQIDTNPGDIVLYNGNAISVFYAPSSWSYTRLGHINLSNNELNEILNKPNVVFVLK